MKKRLVLLLAMLASSSLVMANDDVLEGVASFEESNKWNFIEKRFVTWPHRISIGAIPAKFGGSAAGCVVGFLGLTFLHNSSSHKGTDNVGQKVKKKVKKTDDGVTAELLYLIAIGGAGIGVAVSSYGVADWSVEKLTNTAIVFNFLNNWEETNKQKTPEALHAFFDKEYSLFVKGKVKYIFKRPSAVVDFIRASLVLHK